MRSGLCLELDLWGRDSVFELESNHLSGWKMGKLEIDTLVHSIE